MNATFHFTSAQEITTDVIQAIRLAYREKPVTLNVQEDDPFLPGWQIQEIRRRDAITDNNPAYFLDGDIVISELEKEHYFHLIY